MTLQPSNEHPVESAGITQGAGIPTADLDRMIAATIPDGDDTPTPSADSFISALAEAAQHAKYTAEDLDDALEVAPADITISVGLDLVNAQAYIRSAERLIAHAAATFAAQSAGGA